MELGKHPSNIGRRRKPSSNGEEDQEEASLFEPPADLICPITHELMKDPVINAAGQVYEREAIERAFREAPAGAARDPYTNTPLPSLQLTTVWPMRSKSMAYRDRSAAACVQRACQTSCPAPIRYLRRAAELVQGAEGIKVPGMTPDVATFLLTHHSSVYDFQALLRFGAALQASGGDPSAVYSKVLSTSADTAQQAEALRQLLAYWRSEEEGGCYSGCGDGEAASEVQEEALVVARLARLLQAQEAAAGSPAGGAAHFVDVLLAAQLPESLVMGLCEHLLGAADASGGTCRCCCCGSGAAATAGSLGTASSAAAAAAAAGNARTCSNVQLLYRYVRLHAKEQQRQAAAKPGLPGTASGSGSVAHHNHQPHPHARARRIEQAALGALFAVLTMFERRGGGMARLLKAASLLALVFRKEQQPSAVLA